MPWKRTAFRFLLNRSIISRAFASRVLCVSLSLSAFWLPLFSARADELKETNRVSFTMYTSETNSVRSSSGTKAPPYTAEESLYAIYQMLSVMNVANYMASVPYMWPHSLTIGEFLDAITGYHASQAWQTEDTIRFYLRSILAGVTNRPPVDLSAVSNLLSSIDSSVSALSSRPAPDYSFISNALYYAGSPISETVSSLESALYEPAYGYSVSELFSQVLSDFVYAPSSSNAFNSWADFLGWFCQGQNMFYSGTFNHEGMLNTYLGGLSSSALSDLEYAIHSAMSDYSADISGVLGEVGAISNLLGSQAVYLGDIRNSVTNTEEYARLIHFADLAYDENDTTRNVKNDFHFLHQQLGVENPSRTNNIFALLQRLFDDSSAVAQVSASGSVFQAQVNAAASSAESVIVSTSNDVVAVLDDNEPDWDHDKFTGDNPLDSGDDIFDLPMTQARALLPTLPESQHKEIVIFRGAFPIFGGRSQNRSSSVNLDISYPLEHYDDVSSGMVTLRTIMEWVWALCSCVLCVSMLFRFYTSLATDKLNMEADSALGV